MALLTGALVVLALLGALLWWYIHIPFDMPKNIPRVPIYVSLLGLWSDMGQDEIYTRWLAEPLERYGAVKIWFAGRWNVLTTRPEYLTDMFRNEDVYAKAGSQVKIPWSVIASLVGDNIINTHDNWKLYTAIMKPGMQKRLFDMRPLLDKSRKFVDLLLQQQSILGNQRGVLVNPLIQRYAIAVMGECFLDIDFECLEKPNTRIEELQTIIKQTIFKPLFFNFPALDKYPNIFPSRRRAFEIMKEFEDLLCELVKNRPRNRSGKPRSPDDDLLIHMLEDALKEGRINDEQYRANLKITFLTAHENAQQLLNSVFWEMGQNQDMQNKLRAEITQTGIVNPTADILNKLPYLTSIIYEFLRLYTPVSQLINRVTTRPAVLGGHISIPAHTWVGWNAYGVHIDEAVWGPTAKKFVPERWGTTVDEMQMKFRRECVRGAYIPFNAHTRKCLGQGFALLEMKMVLFEMVRRLRWTVDPEYKLKLTSGGILAPLRVRVILEKFQGDEKSALKEKLIEFTD